MLEISNLTKKFGAFTAVDGVSFQVDEGTLKAIIGPNGAGKTTLYNMISGAMIPSAGTIRFRGENVTGSSPSAIARKGLGRSFQITNVFGGLSVRRNIRIPIIGKDGQWYNFIQDVDDKEGINERTAEIIDLVGLNDIEDEVCSELAYGDRRRVEIAITLATDPDLILLDEPTAGMSPSETNQMVELIKKLHEETGIAIVITEHDMGVVFDLAEEIIVLHNGRILTEGTPGEIESNKKVQSAYLGGNL